MPRPSIEWFGEQMETKLDENDAIKPDWADVPVGELFSHLLIEALELYSAIRNEGREAVIREAADVANLAHAIADKMRVTPSQNRGRA